MANEILLKKQTPVIFSTGGANQNFSIANLAHGAGFRSARIDLGATTQPYKFEWRGYFQLTSTPASLDGFKGIDVYIITSDATYPDGGFASTEGSISSLYKTFNMKQIGSVILDSTSDSTFRGSGHFECYARYMQVAIFNNTGLALSSNQSNNGVIITPVVEEIQ